MNAGQPVQAGVRQSGQRSRTVFINDPGVRSSLSKMSKEMEKSMAVGSGVIQREEDGREMVDAVDRLDIATPRAIEAGEQEEPEVHVPEHRSAEPRTTAFAGPSCEHCNRPLTGRKEKFCSDRCRMQERRAADRNRQGLLLARIKESVRALERELLGERQE